MKTLFYLFLASMVIFSCSDKSAENTKEETASTKLDKKPGWWKEGVIYQIYPRSFKDTDGDGIGDLKGIIQKLDYIKSLGVDMVWLNPIYSSPNADNGYDISDYRNIMDEFGTMEDFDIMLKGMHDRGIKFVMDVVVNHSSDQHEWFKQSRSSRDNPYRDYYHWWPAERGKPNYRYSLFDAKGEAWKYDSLTNAYYLHYFSQQQPDLNWENPKVRQEVYDVMKFWADKGVDGFRLDAFQYVAKDTTFPALPEGYEKEVIKYYGMGPNLHDYLREMNEDVLSKYEVFAVSEGAGSTFEDAHSLVDADRKELQMVYHFEGMDVGNSLDRYKLAEFKKVYSKWDSAFSEKGWLSIFLANHDVARMVSKFGNDSPEYRAASSKMLNTFILSMRGTPYCYYGDELGMTNIDFEKIEQYQDIAAQNSFIKAKSEGADMEAFMETLNFLSRDNGRTPMQWDATENAGFTAGTPWLPVNNNYQEINVTAQDKDPNSCLNYFRKMVAFRKNNPILVYGDYELELPDDEQIFAYTRTQDDKKLLILLNFSTEQATTNISERFNLKQEPVINNYPSVSMEDTSLVLEPYQALIFEVEKSL
ncbi:glycoside hydrolase family 13 protein [Chondrinema litorale]|uniref:glycoside hydrolase family 13 protein n=1 Tax=Chondrinema litorale TaxID=2994555 RepID=UPI0025428219|nr:alpha-glucosidase [Chondrinema litorale]UZR93825.1 alpha-glucosidase [Chondrinema litorale]